MSSPATGLPGSFGSATPSPSSSLATKTLPLFLTVPASLAPSARLKPTVKSTCLSILFVGVPLITQAEDAASNLTVKPTAVSSSAEQDKSLALPSLVTFTLTGEIALPTIPLTAKSPTTGTTAQPSASTFAPAGVPAHLSAASATPSPSSSAGLITVTLDVSKVLSPSLTVTVISVPGVAAEGTETLTLPSFSTEQVAPLSAEHLTESGNAPFFASFGKVTSVPGVPLPSSQAGQPLLADEPATPAHLSAASATPSPSESAFASWTVTGARIIRSYASFPLPYVILTGIR